jgi:hypothetical protein
LREAAASYEGNWRDLVVFVSPLFFTIVWWHVSRQRAHWLLMFTLMILLPTMAVFIRARGVVRTLRRVIHHKAR